MYKDKLLEAYRDEISKVDEVIYDDDDGCELIVTDVYGASRRLKAYEIGGMVMFSSLQDLNIYGGGVK